MAYTLDSGTDEGMLRVLLDDITSEGTPVRGTDYYFEDAELTGLLDLNSDDLWMAASDGCRSLAVKFAKEAQIVGLGKQDIYIDLKKKSEYYILLAKSYDRKSSGTGAAEFVDSYDYDLDGAGVDNSEYIGDDI